MEQEYYTPEQVRDRLGIPLKTLAKWRCRGGGPAFVKFGARVRYSGSDIAAWLDANRRISGLVDATTGRPSVVEG